MGIVFLLGTMGILEIHSLGRLFAHFWPALLILWGVIKLIEYEQAKRYGQPARGIGVGGVFLMVFLIVAGLIATQVSRVDWKNLGDHIQIGDEEGWNEIFGGSTFDYSDELSQDIPAGSTLHVNDDRGTITVNVADGKNHEGLGAEESPRGKTRGRQQLQQQDQTANHGRRKAGNAER